MMYEIHSKNDFQTGAALVVRIPEEEVDKKALYTILSEQPDFILPFRHRSIDGQLEFTYQIGSRSKLAYLSGNRSPNEYAELWFGILKPLIDCGDWFMTPFSFVLKPDYLYCDKNGKSVSFVYIPSVNACSDTYALKSMVTDIAKQNHVTDVQLENKVVWAIQDFNPVDFLQMVKPYRVNPVTESINNESRQSRPEEHQHQYVPELAASVQRKADDISIRLPPDGKQTDAEKPKRGFLSSKKEKEVKPPKSTKESKGKKSFFGKKKAPQDEIIQGAAVLSKHDEPVYEPPVSFQTGEDDDVTQLDIHETDTPKFRYLGNADHPRVIEITVSTGGIFTIGRFDAYVGIKQSSFEFNKKTKAVSRRHAAIERKVDEYVIVDLNSAAGTFVNGQKISPNVPVKLERGLHVSFGNSGADYVWEG